MTAVLETVEFFVAKTLGASEVGAAVGTEQERTADEAVQAEEGMEFAVVWQTTEADVAMDIDIDFGDTEDPFLFMVTAAENVEDSENGTYMFMNSFQVASELENAQQLEAFIDFTFTGGVAFEYTIKFEYGEPGGDNVIMVDLPAPGLQDGSTSSEVTERRYTQQLIFITLGVVALLAVVYYFVL